jgi:hypothetical protein
MDLIGIENEGEFFPAGTLSDALQEELKEISARWTADLGSQNPAERLKRVAESYRAALHQMQNTTDSARRQEIRREASHSLVTALGYEWKRNALETAYPEASLVPVLGRAVNLDGRDVLWLLEAPLAAAGDETADPLGTRFEDLQFSAEDLPHAERARAIEELLAEGVFGLRNGPRFVLIIDIAQLVLVDRNRWSSRSVLRFDLQEIFTRKDPDTLLTMACLISRDARAPETGVPMAERLEEEAQRNANAVTTSLKATVRDAIETLGQEVLEVTGGKYPNSYPDSNKRGRWIHGKVLSLECLRYMYRLLFLFYAEANPRLGILDLRDPLYATGYSIEALRELESVRLRSPQERNGTYLWESLQLTLEMIYTGRGGAMQLPAVKVSLLDPDSTPILSAVKLRNVAVQKIINLLSLKRTRSGTSRISYARLGIGQLGAVYETLISFTGVVAKEDLIELRPQAGRGNSEEASEEETDEEVEDGLQDGREEVETRTDKIDLLAPSYFVPKSRAAEFKPDEIVFEGPTAKVYPKGTFIYRLAGRDREKSASYYTPESLARLLVRHALIERCKDLRADELLELKILEPAMGSAAFLVETTNQLADAYLERKQQESGRTIPQEQIEVEKRKVRSYIADRNCFGVDLNPVAVELGAISLWLNGLHAGDFSPWFGDQLHAGNSLIGARRASYNPKLMAARTKADLWLNHKPQELGWKSRLPEGHIWHWLLPAEDMVKFEKDKSIEEFAGEAQNTIKAWRGGGFFNKFEPHEVKLLQRLSSVAEELFDIVADDLARSRTSVNDAITLWPNKEMGGTKGLDFREKDRRNRKLIGADHASNTLPYKRLKTAMDAWCALWLWPLDKTDKLPNRSEFLHGMAMILEGGFMPDGSLAAPSTAVFVDPSLDLFDQLLPEVPAKDLLQAAKKKQESLFRETDVDTLVQEVEWLSVAADVAQRERFIHFDLIFADVLKAHGGFDLVVGNPPWAKPTWNETNVLGDLDPAFVARALTAPEARQRRAAALSNAHQLTAFLRSYVSVKGAMLATSADTMNPFIGAGSQNLYKCFIDLSFRLLSPSGVAGLIHQDGHLSDAGSSALRNEWYRRIIKHFHFRNEIKSKNFAEIGNTREFSLNVYGPPKNRVRFENITMALTASQVEDCFRHDGIGAVPGLKTAGGSWDTRGHRKRIVEVDERYLAAMHALTEPKDRPILGTRLFPPYSEGEKAIYELVTVGSNFGGIADTWQMSGVWTEGTAERDLKAIKRGTLFQANPDQTILSAPSIYSGNPFYKTPRKNCKSHRDYEPIDLALIDEDYTPRSNFSPAGSYADYRSKLPRCRWNPSSSHVDYYRIAFRRRIALNGERSLIPTIVAPGVAHIHAIHSLNFQSSETLINSHSFLLSLAADFLIKSLGQPDFIDATLSILPNIPLPPTARHRSLRLVCLTKAYADLWNAHAHDGAPMPWHSPDPRLSLDGPIQGPTTWDRTAALRTDFARRMALVEIDVLVAQALGLTLDQLIDIYRIYFPVLQQNEAATWYDRNGRIVWTASKGLPGVGWLNEKGKSPGRREWDEILTLNPAELRCKATVDFLPGGPRVVERIFEGPFDICNRVDDYRRAWVYFAGQKAKEMVA